MSDTTDMLIPVSAETERRGAVVLQRLVRNRTSEHPILFSAPMVQAILENRKTQTRRVVMPQPDPHCMWGYGTHTAGEFTGRFMLHRRVKNVDAYVPCPYGREGDRLWVRETWASQSGMVARRATDPLFPGARWKPSIFMPRWASRLTLEVTHIRVEQLQDITEADANAEGFPSHLSVQTLAPARLDFAILWDKLNAKRGFGWARNPWVWVITFAEISNAKAH